MRNRHSLYLLTLALLAAFPAHAYIDPGAGSYIIQAILAGVLGVLYFFKNIRLFIMNLFVRLFGGSDSSDKSSDS